MVVTGWSLIRAFCYLCRAGSPASGPAHLRSRVHNFAVPAILQVKVFPAEVWVRFNTSFDTLGALRLSWPLVLGRWGRCSASHGASFSGHDWKDLFASAIAAATGPELVLVCGACTVLVCCWRSAWPLLRTVLPQTTWTECRAPWPRMEMQFGTRFGSPRTATLVIGLALTLLAKPARPPTRSAQFSLFNIFNTLVWLPLLVPECCWASPDSLIQPPMALGVLP